MPAKFSVTPVGAFSDNYIWVLRLDDRAVAVDPGDAAPLLAFLRREKLRLEAILITHHHADHCGGLAELSRDWPDAPVYGPPGISGVTAAVKEGDEVPLAFGPAEVLAVPGHTLDHLAYRIGDHLFCGDTMFAAGCGRVFEGTPAQLLASLKKLAQLPPRTKVYPAHEYTLSNLRFALAADPLNPVLAMRQSRDQALREQGLPTLPSTIAVELASNPFLRCQEPAIRASLLAQGGRADDAEADSFARLRAWKNDFR
ncbi:hydroxyacylglutathione hydrolase [Chromobacterium sp. F49]|nr:MULTISPECIES: hydroxyacylglutathione hydrolase [Chromobacterium]KUM02601.1 hydroxyacylglutathione hydrolase [Chromobacterium subtsugae]KZE87987.1 hydroxyacylglutathione hydrolase [Chromobacterium sp. F49]OBU84650.1 hydroxyacylglutathione hydrolase [Chromobacterium subtsugae]WSE90855.1 hydroxyacylglutathione hydrolase [Chromobacterium subtsugae]WVH59228.1 hydroxyacylglutathione hydrolase [Chromobacterium subtsugae]